MGDETPEKTEDQPPNTSVDTFAEIEIEVNKHFGGQWKKFLLAVENPAEIMHFVLTEHFGKDTKKFEEWTKKEDFPPDWVPRFYGTLTPEGELQPEHKSPPEVEVEATGSVAADSEEKSD